MHIKFVIGMIISCSVSDEVRASGRKEMVEHHGWAPETKEAFKKYFEEADANKDGLLDESEWKVF